ncbi:MAG TPA: BPSS1780 family membrane protein [Wenzhouxiangella sp.]
MRPEQRIQRVGAATGFSWLIKSVVLIRQGSGSLVGVGALWLLLSMIAIIPFIGQLMLAMITPLLTAGVLVAFDQISTGRHPNSAVLLTGWHRPKSRPILLLLGLWTIIGAMVALSFLASWLGSQISEPELQAALAAPENLGPMLERLKPGMGLYMAGVSVVVVLMGLYFAIPLSIFGEFGLWPSVRASLVAIFTNLFAFLAFLLTLVAVVGAFLMGLMAIVGVLMQLPGVVGVMLSQIIILVASMGLQILLAGAQYVAFCEIFGWTATAPKSTDADNQSGDGPSDELEL